MGEVGPAAAPAIARAGAPPPVSALILRPVFRLNPHPVHIASPGVMLPPQLGQRSPSATASCFLADASSASAYRSPSPSSSSAGSSLGTVMTWPHLHLAFLPAS